MDCRPVDAWVRAQRRAEPARACVESGLRRSGGAVQTRRDGHAGQPRDRSGEQLTVVDAVRPDARRARGWPGDKIDRRRRDFDRPGELAREEYEEPALVAVLRAGDEL